MIHRSWRLQALGWVVLFWSVFGAHAASPVQATSKGDRLNVRSRPGFGGEVITQLKKGQSVVVLETITLKKPATNEPPVWLRILLPEESRVWVVAEHVDPTNHTVTADVLNVRAGPSYDHASLARVKHGARLKTLGEAKEGWLPIASPADAQGFVPAAFIQLGGEPAPAAVTTPAPAPIPTPASNPTKATGSTNVPPVTVVAPAKAPAPVTPTAAASTPPKTVPPTAPAPAAATPTNAVVAKIPAPTNVPPATVVAPVKEPAAPVTPSTPVVPSKAEPSLRTTNPPPASVPAPAAAAKAETETKAAPVPVTAPAPPPATPPAAKTAAAPAAKAATKPRDDTWFRQFTGTNAAAASATAPVVGSAPVTNATTVVASPAAVSAPKPDSKASTNVVSAPAVIEDPAVKIEPAEPLIPPGLSDPSARRVRREGLVVRPFDVQSPSFFALQSRDSRKVVNFLVSTRPEPINFREYRGKVVIVTGREYLDRRSLWRGVPLLNVETIEAVR